MPTPALAPQPPVVYPDSDGELMADNTEQFEFIQSTEGNLDALLPDFVAGDHLWYPVEGHPEIRRAPDVYVVLGRPKGHRGSYQQWKEEGVPLTVVFEWWSPNSTFAKELAAHAFYERHGVQELYTWDQVRKVFTAFVRDEDVLRVVDTTEGWTSPLLGIRFVVEDEKLVIYRPDGERFLTFRQMRASKEAAAALAEAETARAEAESARAEAAIAERDAVAGRAAVLAAKLRALGIDPDAP